VDWKTKLPEAGSVKVYRWMWHPAQSLLLALLACVVATAIASITTPGGR